MRVSATQQWYLPGADVTYQQMRERQFHGNACNGCF